MSIVLQIYPNGEFTQGVDTSSRRKSRPERICEAMHSSPSPSLQSRLTADFNAETYNAEMEMGRKYISASGSEWTYLCRHERTYHYAVDNGTDDPWVLESEHSPLRLEGMGEIRPIPLGSSDGRIFTERPESRKKCLRMTSSMARNIRNAGYLIQKEYGKDNLSFLTLTLPDLSPEGLKACADNWGKMVDQFLKWLRDRTALRGMPLEYVYCTEVQTKRLQSRGEYALHLHILFRGKKHNRQPWAITPKQARKAWARCIRAVCSEHFKECALENLQRVQRSASGYLSKYLSKGNRVNDGNHPQENIPVFRGHWGGMCRAVSKRIRRCINRFDSRFGNGGFAVSFISRLYRWVRLGYVAYVKKGFVQTSPGEGMDTGRGFYVRVGCLSRPTFEGGLVPLFADLDKFPDISEYDELLRIS